MENNTWWWMKQDAAIQLWDNYMKMQSEKWIKDKYGGGEWVIEGEDPVLPAGLFNDLLDKATDPGTKPRGCTCGTAKTHGNVPNEAHSTWCELVSK